MGIKQQATKHPVESKNKSKEKSKKIPWAKQKMEIYQNVWDAGKAV